jgi:hypothetical protein
VKVAVFGSVAVGVSEGWEVFVGVGEPPGCLVDVLVGGGGGFVGVSVGPDGCVLVEVGGNLVGLSVRVAVGSTCR